MSNSIDEKALSVLRKLEGTLGHLPTRVTAWARLGPLKCRKYRTSSSLRRVSTPAQWMGNAYSRLRCHLQAAGLTLFQLSLHVCRWARELPRFSVTLQEDPGQGPAIAGVCACLFAGLIILSPSLGDFWSAHTFPIVSATDRWLVPFGVSIGPEVATPEAPVSRPMIAVFFGNIMPDDSVVEDSVDEPQQLSSSESISDAPATAKFQDITRPAHWQRTTKTPRVASESFEIRD